MREEHAGSRLHARVAARCQGRRAAGVGGGERPSGWPSDQPTAPRTSPSSSKSCSSSAAPSEAAVELMARRRSSIWAAREGGGAGACEGTCVCARACACACMCVRVCPRPLRAHVTACAASASQNETNSTGPVAALPVAPHPSGRRHSWGSTASVPKFSAPGRRQSGSSARWRGCQQTVSRVHAQHAMQSCTHARA